MIFVLSCKGKEEDKVHVFQSCHKAKAMWLAYLGLRIQEFEVSSFIDLFVEASTSFNEEGLEFFIVTA